MKTLVALALLAIALPLGACGGRAQSEGAADASDADQLPARVVCHSDGRIVLDDFVADGETVSWGSGGMSFNGSAGYTASIGDCSTYHQAKPAGWKPTLPGDVDAGGAEG